MWLHEHHRDWEWWHGGIPPTHKHTRARAHRAVFVLETSLSVHHTIKLEGEKNNPTLSFKDYKFCNVEYGTPLSWPLRKIVVRSGRMASLGRACTFEIKVGQLSSKRPWDLTQFHFQLNFQTLLLRIPSQVLLFWIIYLNSPLCVCMGSFWVLQFLTSPEQAIRWIWWVLNCPKVWTCVLVLSNTRIPTSFPAFLG